MWVKMGEASKQLLCVKNAMRVRRVMRGTVEYERISGKQGYNHLSHLTFLGVFTENTASVSEVIVIEYESVVPRQREVIITQSIGDQTGNIGSWKDEPGHLSQHALSSQTWARPLLPHWMCLNIPWVGHTREE
mgnify:CR=1 FL=1